MIMNSNGKFDDSSISPKIRQILLHWGYELAEIDLLGIFSLATLYSIKMSGKTLKLDNTQINKKEFHKSKQPIDLHLVESRHKENSNI